MRDPKLKLRRFTVILLYPENMCDGGVQTYMAWVKAANTDSAIARACEEGTKDNNGNAGITDWRPLYVFKGFIKSEWSEMP